MLSKRAANTLLMGGDGVASCSSHPLEVGATVSCTRTGVAGASVVEIIERRCKEEGGPWQYCASLLPPFAFVIV